VKELVAGLALVGLASVSKRRSGGAIAGSDDFHFSKVPDLLDEGYELLNSSSGSCEQDMKNIVTAYGLASQAMAHVDSMGVSMPEDRSAASALKSEAMFWIRERSCKADRR